MATLTFRWTGNGIARLATAAHALADNDKRRSAFRRAINHTGNKAFSRTRRELSRQLGTTQSIISRYGSCAK